MNSAHLPVQNDNRHVRVRAAHVHATDDDCGVAPSRSASAFATSGNHLGHRRADEGAGPRYSPAGGVASVVWRAEDHIRRAQYVRPGDLSHRHRVLWAPSVAH